MRTCWQYVNYSTKHTYCPLVSPTNAYTERERLLPFSPFFFFYFFFFFVILLYVRTFFLIILPFLSIHISAWQRFRSKQFYNILLTCIINRNIFYLLLSIFCLDFFFVLYHVYSIFKVILNFEWHLK
jgi:hypothetical protein